MVNLLKNRVLSSLINISLLKLIVCNYCDVKVESNHIVFNINENLIIIATNGNTYWIYDQTENKISDNPVNNENLFGNGNFKSIIASFVIKQQLTYAVIYGLSNEENLSRKVFVYSVVNDRKLEKVETDLQMSDWSLKTEETFSPKLNVSSFWPNYTVMSRISAMTYLQSDSQLLVSYRESGKTVFIAKYLANNKWTEWQTYESDNSDTDFNSMFEKNNILYGIIGNGIVYRIKYQLNKNRIVFSDQTDIKTLLNCFVDNSSVQMSNTDTKEKMSKSLLEPFLIILATVTILIIVFVLIYFFAIKRICNKPIKSAESQTLFSKFEDQLSSSNNESKLKPTKDANNDNTNLKKTENKPNKQKIESKTKINKTRSDSTKDENKNNESEQKQKVNKTRSDSLLSEIKADKQNKQTNSPKKSPKNETKDKLGDDSEQKTKQIPKTKANQLYEPLKKV